MTVQKTSKPLTFHLHTAQVETLLKSHDPGTQAQPSSQQPSNILDDNRLNTPMQGIPDLQMLSADDLALPVDPLTEGLGLGQSTESSIPASQPGLNGDFSWEMISLGLEEPLPRQDVIDKLYVCSRAIKLPNKPLIGVF